MWSPRHEQIVAELIAELPPEHAGGHAARLSALPIGGSMWADYYLRPNGEVVIVGDDFDKPDEDTVHTDPVRVLGVMVWGSRRYPELIELLPTREPGARDCPCIRAPSIFGLGKHICGECGGVGWLPLGYPSKLKFFTT